MKSKNGLFMKKQYKKKKKSLSYKQNRMIIIHTIFFFTQPLLQITLKKKNWINKSHSHLDMMANVKFEISILAWSSGVNIRNSSLANKTKENNAFRFRHAI